jgi:hypothetical protein
MSKPHEWSVVVYSADSGRQTVLHGSEGLCRRVAEQLAARGQQAMAVREGGAA